MPRPRAFWPWTRRVLSLGFLALVLWLLVSRAETIDWNQVLESARGYRVRTLLVAGACAALAHLLYSCFDLLGRAYTRHQLPARRVMAIGQVSYAFSLNLGALIGGFGFRFRLYSRFGLKRGVIARVLTLSIASNWLGYMVLAGGVFVTRSLKLPPTWAPGASALQLAGAALLAVAAGYLLACAFSRKRDWHVRSVRLHLPSIRMAALQLVLSAAHWLAMALVLFVLFQETIGFGTVLGVLLCASVAGAIAHIPAGLGVLEAVFLTFLEGAVPQGLILAALLTYRAVYYLLPLIVAIALYLALEARARSKVHHPRYVR